MATSVHVVLSVCETKYDSAEDYTFFGMYTDVDEARTECARLKQNEPTTDFIVCTVPAGPIEGGRPLWDLMTFRANISITSGLVYTNHVDHP
jgi:hypothetical protein